MARASTAQRNAPVPAPEAPAIKTDLKRATAQRVVVMCKIPNGLILQLQQKQSFPMSTRDGIVREERWIYFGDRYWVAGPAYPNGQTPKGFPRRPVTEGGYAMTKGIPKDFWERWVEQHKDAEYVIPKGGAEHGMIYAMDDEDDAIAVAIEQAKQLSGLEPLDVETLDKDGRFVDPRMPQPMNMAVGKLQPMDGAPGQE